MNSFADFFWAMIVVYFWFMVIWIFIRLFGDIFRRTDLSGAMKAIWVVALFVIPFLGAVVYMVTRPRLPQDDLVAATNAAPQQPVITTSTAEEISKLTVLRDSGVLTPTEFDLAKAKALA